MTRQEKYKEVARIAKEMGGVFLAMAQLPEDLLETYDPLQASDGDVIEEGRQILADCRATLDDLLKLARLRSQGEDPPRGTGAKPPS